MMSDVHVSLNSGMPLQSRYISGRCTEGKMFAKLGSAIRLKQRRATQRRSDLAICPWNRADENIARSDVHHQVPSSFLRVLGPSQIEAHFRFITTVFYSFVRFSPGRVRPAQVDVLREQVRSFALDDRRHGLDALK